MSSTIRTYRHSPNVAGDATGTLVDTETDADDGNFTVTVDATGWANGSYQITCTREDTTNGLTESEHSNALDLTVSSTASDDFNRANETLGAPNWTQVGIAGGVAIVNQRASPTAGSGNNCAVRWSGTAIDNTTQVVIAHCGPGVAFSSVGSGVAARFQAADQLFLAQRSSYTSGAGTWEFIGRSGSTVVSDIQALPTDEWVKIVTSGTQATFYTSSDGVTWGAAKFQASNAAFTFTAQPGIKFTSGYGPGSAADFWVDDFSAS